MFQLKVFIWSKLGNISKGNSPLMSAQHKTLGWQKRKPPSPALIVFPQWSCRFYLWFTNNLVYYGLTFNLGIDPLFDSFSIRASPPSKSPSKWKHERHLAGKLVPGNLHMNMMVSGALEILAYTVAIFAFLKWASRFSSEYFLSHSS